MDKSTPSLSIHAMRGVGFPEAIHMNTAIEPADNCSEVGVASTLGVAACEDRDQR